MEPKRPNIDDYSELTDNLATYKDALSRKKYNLEKKIAQCLRTAIQQGSKTKDLDVVKVLGNTEEDTKELESLRREVWELERLISSTFGMMESWKWAKELYITDSYHQIR